VTTPLPAANLPKLRWRCRRGMKELDLLLRDWLDTRFEAASEAERGGFQALLELPDPQLARYLLGNDTPSDPAIAALVAQLASARH
jgi:antitoxin CptB